MSERQQLRNAAATPTDPGDPGAVGQVPTLPEPLTIGEWWKNRSGVSIRVRLSTYEGHNLVDIRSWHPSDDGVLKPGKGFACTVKHLPKLIAVLTKAVAKARELGLIEGEREAAS